MRTIDENADLIKAVQAGVGTKCKLTGHAVNALTAAGGGYVLVWAPEAVGLVGFVLLPERLTHNSNPEDPVELEAVVQKVWLPIPQQQLEQWLASLISEHAHRFLHPLSNPK